MQKKRSKIIFRKRAKKAKIKKKDTKKAHEVYDTPCMSHTVCVLEHY